MIEGLSYLEAFLDADEQRTLLTQLEQLSYYHDTFLGRLIKRKYAQFGYAYKSTGRILVPAAPFPAFLTDLMERGRSACGDSDPINQCS